MASLNDEKFRALGVLGSTAGDLIGRWRQYLITNTPGSSESMGTVELEDRFLDNAAVPTGNRNDRWYAWLGTQGRTGTLNDRWLQHWSSIV